MRACATLFACLLIKTNFKFAPKESIDLHFFIKHPNSEASPLPEEHVVTTSLHFKHGITQLQLEDSMKCFMEGQGFNLNWREASWENPRESMYNRTNFISDYTTHTHLASLQRSHHSSCILAIRGQVETNRKGPKSAWGSWL